MTSKGTSRNSRKTRCPSENIASCGRSAPKDGKQNTFRGEVENGGELGGRTETRRREEVGSVGADRGYLENQKEAETEAQGAEG